MTEKLKKFLRNFNYKRNFKNSLGVVLRNGIYYGWFRDSYGTVNDDPIELDDSYKVQKESSILPTNTSSR